MKNINPIKISTIICTKNREYDLKKCLFSLIEQTEMPYEIIIVDAGNTEEIYYYLKYLCNERKIKFKYVKQTKGRLSVARNISIDKVDNDSDIVLFLDDDVILDKNYIKEILSVYTADTLKIIKGAGGLNLNLTINPIQNILCRFFMLNYHSDRSKILSSGVFTFPTKIKKAEKADILFGYNMSYRKEIFDEFKFDEYFDYIDDIDFSYRISKKYVLITTHNAKTYHNHSSIRNYEKQTKMYTYGHYYFFNKLIEKNLKNNLCFIWSIFGQFIGYFCFFLIKPSKRNYYNITGSVKGCLMILKNRNCNKRIIF